MPPIPGPPGGRLGDYRGRLYRSLYLPPARINPFAAALRRRQRGTKSPPPGKPAARLGCLGRLGHRRQRKHRPPGSPGLAALAAMAARFGHIAHRGHQRRHRASCRRASPRCSPERFAEKNLRRSPPSEGAAAVSALRATMAATRKSAVTASARPPWPSSPSPPPADDPANTRPRNTNSARPRLGDTCARPRGIETRCACSRARAIPNAPARDRFCARGTYLLRVRKRKNFLGVRRICHFR